MPFQLLINTIVSLVGELLTPDFYVTGRVNDGYDDFLEIAVVYRIKSTEKKDNGIQHQKMRTKIENKKQKHYVPYQASKLSQLKDHLSSLQ